MLYIGDDLPGRERRIVALDDRAADDEIVRSRGNRLRRGAGALVIVGRGAGKPYSRRRDQQARRPGELPDPVWIVVRSGDDPVTAVGDGLLHAQPDQFLHGTQIT